METQEKPKRKYGKRPRTLDGRRLSGAVKTAFTQNAERHVARFESRLAEVVTGHMADAERNLERISKAGELLAKQLETHSQLESPSIDDTDTLTKIFERLVTLYRRILRLDDVDRDKQSSVRIGLFLQCGRPGETMPEHMRIRACVDGANSTAQLDNATKCNTLIDAEHGPSVGTTNAGVAQNVPCAFGMPDASEAASVPTLPSALQGSRERGLAKTRAKRLANLAKAKAKLAPAPAARSQAGASGPIPSPAPRSQADGVSGAGPIE